MTNYYDSLAPGYNQLYGQEQTEKLVFAASYISLDKDATILDVGCGTGISTDFWVDTFGCKTTGIDPSQKLIAQNTARKSEFVVGFAEKLPFKDHSFDVVVSFSAIQNFSDIKKGLLEMKRVGKKIFLFSVMNRGENFDKIDHIIEEIFEVKQKKEKKNDTFYLIK